MLQNMIFVTFPSPGLAASLASNAPHILSSLLSWGSLFLMTWLGDKFQQQEHLSTSIMLIRVLIQCDEVRIMLVNKDLRICMFCCCLLLWGARGAAFSRWDQCFGPCDDASWSGACMPSNWSVFSGSWRMTWVLIMLITGTFGLTTPLMHCFAEECAASNHFISRTEFG